MWLQIESFKALRPRIPTTLTSNNAQHALRSLDTSLFSEVTISLVACPNSGGHPTVIIACMALHLDEY